MSPRRRRHRSGPGAERWRCLLRPMLRRCLSGAAWRRCLPGPAWRCSLSAWRRCLSARRRGLCGSDLLDPTRPDGVASRVRPSCSLGQRRVLRGEDQTLLHLPEERARARRRGGRPATAAHLVLYLGHEQPELLQVLLVARAALRHVALQLAKLFAESTQGQPRGRAARAQLAMRLVPCRCGIGRITLGCPDLVPQRGDVDLRASLFPSHFLQVHLGLCRTTRAGKRATFG